MSKHLSRALALLIIVLGLSTLGQTPATALTDRDCGDFSTQAAAQAFMLASGPGDPHGLDGNDNDGRACESLPCPCGSTAPQPIASNTNNTTPPPPTVYRETGNVTQIVDGDTLKVRLRAGGIVSVRMLGIDTPERGRCGSDAATDNLREHAPVGSTVNLVSDRTQAAKDRYGRLLRYVARQGGYADLSYRQMWNGFSKPYIFGGEPVARHRDYVRASSVARNQNRGLWSSCW